MDCGWLAGWLADTWSIHYVFNWNTWKKNMCSISCRVHRNYIDRLCSLTTVHRENGSIMARGECVCIHCPVSRGVLTSNQLALCFHRHNNRRITDEDDFNARLTLSLSLSLYCLWVAANRPHIFDVIDSLPKRCIRRVLANTFQGKYFPHNKLNGPFVCVSIH